MSHTYKQNQAEQKWHEKWIQGILDTILLLNEMAQSSAAPPEMFVWHWRIRRHLQRQHEQELEILGDLGEQGQKLWKREQANAMLEGRWSGLSKV